MRSEITEYYFYPTLSIHIYLSGVIVDIGMKHVEAFIPLLHLTDVPMTHPERKFNPGDKLHCRVLRVDPSKHRIHLTSKPILVKRDDYDIVQSFDVSNVGKVTEGVVVKLTDRGLLLQLFGEAQGWVPKTMISTEVVEHPEKLFFLGQALKCQVVRTGKHVFIGSDAAVAARFNVYSTPPLLNNYSGALTTTFK